MELMAEFPDNHFDLAVVDPPYGIGAENHAGGSKNGWNQWEKKEWDKSIPKPEYFVELRRVSREQIVWGGNYMTEHLPPSMGWILWDKGQRNFSLADGELAWTSFHRALRIFEMSRGACLAEGERHHPTQKPVKLYDWIFANYAEPGMKILDTHMGSGSIAIAAHYAGMILTACELDEKYYNAACQRIEMETSQLDFLTPQIK
jgi:site-specific DNA-methyltransferase (adenine-specific)